MREYAEDTSQAKLDRYDRKLQKRVERRGRRNFVAVSALAGVALTQSMYWADVRHNEEIEANAEIDIEVFLDPLDPENNDTAFIFFNGFGENDADLPAEYFGPAMQQFVADGEVWSIGYGNAPLIESNIADKIIERATERGIKWFSVFGNSAGGNISIRTIEYILERSDLQLEAIVPDAMPDGDKGIRQEQREAKKILMTVADIVPGATHSSWMRFIGEMVMRRGNYDSGDPIQRLEDFSETVGIVAEALEEERLPSTWLMIDQVLAVSNSKLEQRFAHIAELTEGSLKPVVIYLGNENDRVIKTEMSSENVCTYAESAGLECLIYNIPGAVHNRPEIATDEYVEAISEASPDIQAALSRALTNYYSIAHPYLPPGAI
jgi:hypothetical protein